MTNKKNLKITQESYDLLKAEKGKYETWDGFIHRVFNDD